MSTAEDERYIPGSEIVSRVVDSVRSLGEQTAFIGNALGSTVDAVRRYPGEVLRLIAVLGMGTGALAVIGGTVVIVGFLTLTTGALIALVVVTSEGWLFAAGAELMEPPDAGVAASARKATVTALPEAFTL